MAFGSDDAALRAAGEPHISLILELNFYRPMFAAFFFFAMLSVQLIFPRLYICFSKPWTKVMPRRDRAKRKALPSLTTWTY
jgi:hypothetical protein